MTDAKSDEQNSVQPENEKALAQNATDTISQVVEGAAQLAEKARKSGERYVEEGRRRFPEAEEYDPAGPEVLSSQVQAGPAGRPGGRSAGLSFRLPHSRRRHALPRPLRRHPLPAAPIK